MLYAVNSGDKSPWYVVTTPVLIPFLVCAFLPLGIWAIFWLLFLVFMNKTDAYQLASYVATTRVIGSILYGLAPLLSGYFSFMLCSLTDSCESSAPGASGLSVFSEGLLFVNWLSGYYVFYLYIALRNFRRAHAAILDKNGDGKLTIVEIKRMRVEEPGVVEESFDEPADDAHAAFWGSPVKTDELKLMEINSAMRTATTFRCMMYYDMVVFGILVLVLTAGFYGMDVWHFRMLLKFCSTLLGLAALPFLIFIIPGISSFVLRMPHTGYDANGGLKLRLPLRAMRKKWELENRDANNIFEKSKKLANKASSAKSYFPSFGFGKKKVTSEAALL